MLVVQNSLFAQNLNVESEYLFTVGEQTEFGEPGYLYMPQSVATDSEGRIFVSDHRGRTIHMYTPEGAYMKSFGGPGRGPGEFNRITEIAIDENDNLLVLDRFQFKVTRFNISKNTVEEHFYEDMPEMSTMTLAPLCGDRFASVYVGMEVPGSTESNLNAVRVYQFGENEAITTHFEIFKHQFDNQKPIEENMARGIGHKLASVGGDVLVAGHTVYAGKLFFIDVKSDQVTEAVNPGVKPPYYIEYDIDSISEIPDVAGRTSSSGRAGSFRYQVINYSHLIDSSDNRIFHFFRENEERGGTKRDVMEIFDQDGTFLGQTSISDHFDYGQEVRVFYSHIDETGRLFIRRYFDDRDADVRVYKIRWSDIE